MLHIKLVLKEIKKIAVMSHHVLYIFELFHTVIYLLNYIKSFNFHNDLKVDFFKYLRGV